MHNNSVANKRLRRMVWKMFWIRSWQYFYASGFCGFCVIIGLYILLLYHEISTGPGYTCKTPLIAEFWGTWKQNTKIAESSSQNSTTESPNILCMVEQIEQVGIPHTTFSLDGFGHQLWLCTTHVCSVYFEDSEILTKVFSTCSEFATHRNHPADVQRLLQFHIPIPYR